ncbi:MAG TPA: SPFH domain-containing protein [Chitinophagaceae bacterium]|nr:SPFH domain-containing protein [Chitinophagaceae bacterium]
MEKIIKPISGFLVLILIFIGIAFSIYLMVLSTHNGTAEGPNLYFGIALMVVSLFFLGGLVVINPNQSRVCTFFGKYSGTIKNNGLMFVNPFFHRRKVSLRFNNFESPKLKVNDKMGNPVEIAAVVVWQVSDTYKAIFDITDYEHYVRIQSESAIRHLATTCPYDEFEDSSATVTLRNGGDKVIEMLEQELSDRLFAAGIIIREARITHLAYAQEIAGDMLRRQQATAIVAARFKIVEGAVGMVELALEMLSKKEIVNLDEEKKAAMVSNLMVVLCGEKSAQPVLNTGTLYQ